MGTTIVYRGYIGIMEKKIEGWNHNPFSLLRTQSSVRRKIPLLDPKGCCKDPPNSGEGVRVQTWDMLSRNLIQVTLLSPYSGESNGKEHGQ